MEKFSELSYREIQARAKELGIAANKKREALIEAILERESAEESIVKSPVSTEAVEVVEVTEVAEVVESVESSSVDIEVETANALETSVEYFDSVNPEIVEEAEFYECEAGDVGTEDLADEFEKMQLKGIPNPTGTKIVFDEMETNEIKKIDWGVNFEEINSENQDISNQYPARSVPIPQGKHTIFSSPDLVIGKATHWTYEDYDKKSTQSTMQPSNSVLMTATTPKALQSSEERMQFWLSKGPKTPLR